MAEPSRLEASPHPRAIGGAQPTFTAISVPGLTPLAGADTASHHLPTCLRHRQGSVLRLRQRSLAMARRSRRLTNFQGVEYPGRVQGLVFVVFIIGLSTLVSSSFPDAPGKVKAAEFLEDVIVHACFADPRHRGSDLRHSVCVCTPHISTPGADSPHGSCL